MRELFEFSVHSARWCVFAFFFSAFICAIYVVQWLLTKHKTMCEHVTHMDFDNKLIVCLILSIAVVLAQVMLQCNETGNCWTAAVKRRETFFFFVSSLAICCDAVKGIWSERNRFGLKFVQFLLLCEMIKRKPVFTRVLPSHFSGHCQSIHAVKRMKISINYANRNLFKLYARFDRERERERDHLKRIHLQLKNLYLTVHVLIFFSRSTQSTNYINAFA